MFFFCQSVPCFFQPKYIGLWRKQWMHIVHLLRRWRVLCAVFKLFSIWRWSMWWVHNWTARLELNYVKSICICNFFKSHWCWLAREVILMQVRLQKKVREESNLICRVWWLYLWLRVPLHVGKHNGWHLNRSHGERVPTGAKKIL